MNPRLPGPEPGALPAALHPDVKNSSSVRAAAISGWRRRIRTLTNRVRVCRATLTQSRCIAPVIAGAGFIIPKQFHLSSFFAKFFAGFFLDKGPAFFYNMEQYQQKRGREQDLCVPLREPVVGANRRGDSRCILAPELSA